MIYEYDVRSKWANELCSRIQKATADIEDACKLLGEDCGYDVLNVHITFRNGEMTATIQIEDTPSADMDDLAWSLGSDRVITTDEFNPYGDVEESTSINHMKFYKYRRGE